MKVYALVGKSGTGKSYQAINLCRNKNIESIIDDGLFIYKNSSFTGISAKKVDTKIGAIKTALFSDDNHRMDVIESIQENQPESILILGTSDEMVKRIAKALMLPEIDEIIYIEDITTEEERAAARKNRTQQGKHVVPIPQAHLKREFSGYFTAPLRMLKGLGRGHGVEEKTVVRPTYSYLGEYIISDKAIANIVELVSRDMGHIVTKLRVISEKRAGQLKVTILAVFKMDHDSDDFVLMERLKNFQERCAYRIEEMTAFSIDSIDIEVRGVV